MARRNVRIWCVVFIAAVVSAGVAAAEDAEYRFDTRVVRIPLPDGTGELETYLYVPDGKGPFPAIILNHGSPRTAQERTTRPRYGTAGTWFARRGFVVAVPSRRGYGRSAGPYSEGFGSCRRPDYARAAGATASDIETVLRWLRDQSTVDAERILAAGQSAGGFGVLALAARRPPGLIAVLNFAGGRGSPSNGRNCRADLLVKTAQRFGATTRIPSLWAYSKNDQLFSQSLARQLYTAHARDSRSASMFVELPAYGEDGHAVFGASDGPLFWGPTVADFLRTVGISIRGADPLGPRHRERELPSPPKGIHR